MKRTIDAKDLLPVVGGNSVRPGPFTEWPDKEALQNGAAPIHYGPNWPENPFDWHFGCAIVPLDPDA